MTPFQRYCQLYECTDLSNSLVVEEIAQGIRIPDGLTDVHHHLPRLRELAKGNVLEIGVRFGASTAALLAGVEEKGGHVWSVDIDSCDFARSLFEGHPQWTFTQADSKWPPLRDNVVPRELDLLFIDGDHTLEGLSLDLINFGPRAKVVAVHDAGSPVYWDSGNPQVLRAIGSYLKSGLRHKKLRVYRDSNGLAVLS